MASNLTFSPIEQNSDIARSNTDIKVNDAASFAATKIADGELIKRSVAQSDNGSYTVRYAISDVKNVYTGTDVDPTLYGAIKRGKTLLIKVRHTGTKMENGVEVHYPIEAGITLKYPVNTVNAEDVYHVLREAIGALGNPKDTTDLGQAGNLGMLMLGAFPVVSNETV